MEPILLLAVVFGFAVVGLTLVAVCKWLLKAAHTDNHSNALTRKAEGQKSSKTDDDRLSKKQAEHREVKKELLRCKNELESCQQQNLSHARSLLSKEELLEDQKRTISSLERTSIELGERVSLLQTTIEKKQNELLSCVQELAKCREQLEIASALRIVGKYRSSCHDAPMLMVQSMSGGYVTANCSVCGNSRSLSHDHFNDLDIWVDCPECRCRANSAMVDKNYGFQCIKCGWQCHLASLLPSYSELLPK